MAEVKKADVKPAEKAPEPPALAPAGASGDAGVQFLLALRSTHTSNEESAKVDEIDRQLAELGFTAK